MFGPRWIVEKPWSDTTMMSVFSNTLFSFSALITSARFLSLTSTAASDVVEPTPVSCCDLSGSLNHSSVYFGTPFLQSERINERVVQLSCPELGCVTVVGNALSSFTFGNASPAARGSVFPSNNVTDCRSTGDPFLHDRSCSNTTGFEPAVIVGMPASCKISGNVAARM